MGRTGIIDLKCVCVGQADRRRKVKPFRQIAEREREEGSRLLGKDLLPLLLRLFVCSLREREIRGHVTDLTQTGFRCVGGDNKNTSFRFVSLTIVTYQIIEKENCYLLNYKVILYISCDFTQFIVTCSTEETYEMNIAVFGALNIHTDITEKFLIYLYLFIAREIPAVTIPTYFPHIHIHISRQYYL